MNAPQSSGPSHPHLPSPSNPKGDGAAPLRSTLRAPIPSIPRRVHLLGAGGAGVSGVARVLVDHGHAVSGHDRAESEHTARLRAMGVKLDVCAPSEARLPAELDLVIRSAAVSLEDPLVRAAQERGVAVLKYSEALGRVTPMGRTLAIAGTHGKTTTSWMTYHALRAMAEAAQGGSAPRPGAIIGGACRTLATNAITEDPDGWFAVEACEYDRSFLNLSPQGAVVTNVEADHLDYFGDLDTIKSAFARFADRVAQSGVIVVGREVTRSVERSARCPVLRLGRELRIDLIGERSGRFTFRLSGPNFVTPPVELSAPGHFNVDNAACAIGVAVLCAAKSLGLTPQVAAEAAARGVASYVGAERRFEPWGEASGVTVVHDYAHHPTEVRVTLETARRAFPGRALHVLFQPHQHSRTARFLEEFAESLRMADRVVIADVYGARLHVDGEHLAGAPELVEQLRLRGVDAVAGGALDGAVRAAAEGIASPSAMLVLGAGDIVRVQHDLLTLLADRGAVQRGSRR